MGIKKFLLISVFLVLTLVNSSRSQWLVNACGLPYNSTFPSLIIETASYSYAATQFGVFSNSKEGEHWSLISGEIQDSIINCLLKKGDYIFMGTNKGHIFYTTNHGVRWEMAYSDIPSNISVNSLALNGDVIFAGLTGRYVYISQNNGSNWTSVSNGLPVSTNGIVNLIANGSSVYALTDGGGIYKTQNNGSNWQNISSNLTNQNIRSLSFMGSNLIIGTIGGGIFISSNAGVSWQQKNSGLGNLNVNAVTVVNTRIVAGTNHGVYISSNNGVSWFERNEGWSNPKVLCFSMGTNLNVGTDSLMVWMRTVEQIVSVHNVSTIVPEEFSLEQNYPNPFNPSTKIRFDIAGGNNLAGMTTLKIFDIVGKEVATLVNEQLQPGTFEVTFDGTNLPSGIYYCRLSSGDITSTKKMILLK